MKRKAILHLIVMSLIIGLSGHGEYSANIKAKKSKAIQKETSGLNLEPSLSKEEWENEEGYPINYNDDEWDYLTYKEALEACEMPQDLLKEKSTEELAEYVVNYPYLGEIYFFNSIEDGIENLVKKSNICSEFFNREDWVENLIKEYRGFECDYNKVLKGNETETIKYFQENFIESYLGKHSNELSDIQVSDIMDSMEKKFEEKPEAIRDSSLTASYFGAEYEASEEINEEVVPKNMLEYYEQNTRSSTGFESTGPTIERSEQNWNGDYFKYEVERGKYKKYGTSMYCYRFKSGADYNDETKRNWENYLKSIHPAWTVKLSATVKYNCHSYAWLEKKSDNKYWLNSPDKYASSSSFSKIGKNKTCKKSDKVVLNSSTTYVNDENGKSKAMHSVIMTDSKHCISKLGFAPGFETSLDDMMTCYCADHYVVYRAK